MKKNYFFKALTALALLMGSVANAQTIFSIVGNGNSSNPSTSYPAPFGNWYYGSHHQMRVTAAELVTAGMSAGANVTSVGFSITATNGAAAMQNWQVTVYTTTATDPLVSGYLTTGAVSTSTLTTVNGVNGWYQTPIAPFVWNGTDNLVIETCQVNPGGYTYNYSTVYTTTLTGTEVKTRYYYQDLITTCPTNANYTSATTRPDIRFEWNYLTPCAGIPGANSVNTPTFQLCPNVPYGAIGLANTYTVSGLQYQWLQSTTSNVGPFSPVPSNGTSWTYAVPGLTTTTWYQAVITCTNSNQSFTTTGSPMQVAATTTSLVPYNESFESIGQNDRLPNCSWFAANQGTTVKTFTSAQSNNRSARTGNSFMVFNLPSTNNAVYSNGVQLEPGITYSAGAFFKTEYFGYSNWSNLNIAITPSQSATNATVIATQAPALSGPYKLISGTFQVASSGIYYLAINATGTSGSAPYISIDDVFINIPCTQASGNTPTVSLSASTQTICLGDAVSLNATGADTYAWSTGASGANTSDTPLMPNTVVYTVIGTNTLTGCTNSQSVSVLVNPAPTVNAFASAPSVCPGETSYLSATGANSYAWNVGQTGAVINVNPTSTTSYSVIGTNNFGCTSTGVVTVSVKPLPTIVASSSNLSSACIGDQVTLTANGGVTYNWYSSSSSQLYSGNPVVIIMQTSSTFTVVGTGANGCSAKATVTQAVDICQSITENGAALNGLSVYPNPTTSMFTVELKSGLISSLQVTDVTGRVIMSTNVNNTKSEVNLDGFSSGVYYVKINSDNNFSVVRVVKN